MAAAAPTGCFKCGRPGHWSRDCPSAPSSSLPNSNPNPRSNFPSSSKFSNTAAASSEKPAAAPKKAPKTRPKLTPDLLLSEDGLGYVLRHFPRSFKYRGRGHEASDLGNLIGLYTQWHSHLLPYYSFDQFVQKVEQVGASRRVRRCMAELRERVARGGDPTKLHEPPAEEVKPDGEQEVTDMRDQNVDVTEGPESPLDNHGADEIQEEMLDEIYQKATEESPSSLQEKPLEVPQTTAAYEANPVHRSSDEAPSQVEATAKTTSTAAVPSKIQVKISSFFKTDSDAPQISTQIDGEPEIFCENDHPKVLVTYKRRDPKPNECSSDDGVIRYDINEVDIDNGFTANTSSKSVSLSKVLNKKRTYSQFHLELGQSDFLLHTCSVCGLTYARGNEGDEKVHKTFHKDFYQGIQFKGWRNERVVSGCKSNRDRIVLVLDSDPPTQKDKVEQVVKTMEKELGFGDGMLLHELCKVYLFISNHRIVGCLIAESIKTAHRVVSSSNPCKSSDDNCKTITNLVSLKPEDMGKDAKRASSSSLQFGNIKFLREIVRKDDPVDRLKLNQGDDGAILCEEEAVPVVCGVRAIWVAPSKRRNRVASKLLDAMRKSFCRGYKLEISQCAFSSPTSAGKLLATSYSGTKSFLIYKSLVG